MKSDSPVGRAVGPATLLGLLLGAAAVLLLFRADLFGPHESGASPRPSLSSSSFTTTVTSATGTVTPGPGQSMLDQGELRRAVESFTQGGAKRRVLTVVAKASVACTSRTPAVS